MTTDARSAGPAATTADLLRQLAVIAALVATLVVNYLSTALPLNGRTPGEISDSFPSLVTPAGYVFSIWGVIYLALAAYAVYQAAPARRAVPALRAVGWLFVLTCVLNSAWIYAFHYGSYVLSLALMVGLLVTLIAIYRRLGDGPRTVAKRLEDWALRLPFSLYLGWITIATIANTTVVLLDAGWGGWGLAPEVWAVLVLFVGGGINAYVARTRRDVAFSAVFVWAYLGVAVKHAAVQPVALAASVLAVAVVVALALARRRGAVAVSP